MRFYNVSVEKTHVEDVVEQILQERSPEVRHITKLTFLLEYEIEHAVAGFIAV
jgi:hypothetical protein